MTARSLESMPRKANFDEGAAFYDHWAIPQRQSARRLVKLALGYPVAGPALDAGCGTGLVIGEIQNSAPGLTISGADISQAMVENCQRRFPDLRFYTCDLASYIEDENYQTVLSNYCFQWFDNPLESIGQLVKRALRPGGFMMVALPVKGSLPELHESYYQATGRSLPGMNFPEESRLIGGIDSLELFHFQIDEDRAHFSSAKDCLRHFRMIGADFRGSDHYRPLSRRELLSLLEVYTQGYSDGNGTPVSYRTLTMIARKPE